MSSSNPYPEEPTSSRRQRVAQYYGKKVDRFSRDKKSKPMNWERSGSSMKGFVGQIGTNLDILRSDETLTKAETMIAQLPE